MTLPGRTHSSPAYRYGFNGKEKDDELKGEGNSYDFGARMLDPRVGRWFARDPLERKYPSISPYNYTANNPILYIDPDGKDYGVYIDHKTKTIIIKQTFHTVKGVDATLANMGAATWNKESGQWLYVFGEGDNAVSYKIEYQLTVKEHDDEIKRDEAFRTDTSGEGNLFKTGILTDNSEYGETFINESGSGLGYNYIITKNDQYARDNNVYAHEIGHTLGLGHFVDGLMIDGNFEDKRTNFNISLGNISRMLSYASLGYPKKGFEFDLQIDPIKKTIYDKATSHIKGTPPINFEKGSVIKNEVGPRKEDGSF